MQFSVEILRGKAFHKIASFEEVPHADSFCRTLTQNTVKLVENWPRRRLLATYTNGQPDREPK